MEKLHSKSRPAANSSGITTAGDDILPIITAGIELDYIGQRALRLGRKLRIGAIEFKLLSLFATFPGRLFGREELVKLAWGESSCVDLRTVDAKIMRLRKALTVGGAPDPIRSIWSKGYKLNERCEEDFQAWLASGKKKVRLKPVAPERRR